MLSVVIEDPIKIVTVPGSDPVVRKCLCFFLSSILAVMVGLGLPLFRRCGSDFGGELYMCFAVKDCASLGCLR